jgi:hypothetical protein
MHADRIKTETTTIFMLFFNSSKKVIVVIIDEQLKWKEHNDAQCKKQFPVNEPIAECAKHHGSLVTQQNFSTWRLYFSNEERW